MLRTQIKKYLKLSESVEFGVPLKKIEVSKILLQIFILAD